jgi:three-Cys-motif partner protein
MQEFGGSSTWEKLERVGRYLSAYQIALKNQSFRKIYIDPFAGTGYWTPKVARDQLHLALSERIEIAKGSALRALEVEPPFDRYIFIEKKPGNFSALQKNISLKFPNLLNRIEFINADANHALIHLCRSVDWNENRAVTFLDPFGMQVDRATLSAIAGTHSVDVWYLFPSHMGVARTVTHNPQVPPHFRKALDRIYGTTDWEDYFYRVSSQGLLFVEDAPSVERVATLQRIESYTRLRLESIFKGGVAKKAVPMDRDGRNMYLLFFVVGNPKPAARELALRLANNILE